MNTIYLDVLIIINLYVTFFLIKSTIVFLHKKISTLKIVLGSITGAVSSLLILLPELHFLLNIAVKLVLCVIISLVIFGKSTKKEFFKNTFVFLIINFIFAGVMAALWLFSAPLGMYYNNGFAYFDISFFTICISTIAAYFAIKLVRYLLDTKTNTDKNYVIKVGNCGKEVLLTGFSDSGNTLTDFFSGMPVIICDFEACKNIIPNEISHYSGENFTEFIKNDNLLIKGIRLLPYSTVGASGIIPAFKPDSIKIISGKNTKSINALIGIIPNNIKNEDFDAIFNPKLLI